MTEAKGPEIVLWRAVLTQAITDARRKLADNTMRPEAEVNKAQATEWIRSNCADFRAVCELADVDPDYMHQQLMAEIGRNEL